MVDSESGPKDQSLIDLAALYATLILIIGTVVSKWPPEGQKDWFPVIFNDIVFVLSVIGTLLIVFRFCY